MDRKEFLASSAGLIILGCLSMMGLAAKQTEKEKKYIVIAQRCDGCGHCFNSCKDHALITTKEGKADIDPKKCLGCGDCARFCRRMAIIEQTNKSA
jgi:MinD superfamily P-loop ATPase